MGDGPAYRPLQPGAAIGIGPDGRLSHARSPRGPGDYGGGYYELGTPGHAWGRGNSEGLIHEGGVWLA